MYKIAGLVLAVVGLTALGFFKSDEFRQRKIILSDFYDLLLRISTEIGYFKEPLPGILEKLSGTDNSKTSLMLRLTLSAYLDKQQALGQCWKEAVDDVYCNDPLTAEDLQIMKKCGDFLGQSDYESQKKYFSFVLDKLTKQINEADEFFKIKGRMYSKLGISAGLVLAVILI